MNMDNVWNNEAALTLIAAVATVCWSLLKGSAFLRQFRNDRFRRALEILEAGVEETYRTYVSALKAGRADGKLTQEERRRARELARERAQAIARQQGINLLRDIGEPLLDLWIGKLVKRLKRA